MTENILIVYKNDWIIKRVYEVSDRIRFKVVDQTKFEDRCIKRLANYLSADESNKHNRMYIERLIQEVAAAELKRNKKEYAELFSDFATENNEGDSEIDFDPIDVLADVESEVVAKEMVDLLAQDDLRNKMILEYWLLENTNTALISRSLARAFGGNDKSHRVHVYRFRESCRNQLSAAV